MCTRQVDHVEQRRENVPKEKGTGVIRKLVSVFGNKETFAGETSDRDVCKRMVEYLYSLKTTG